MRFVKGLTAMLAVSVLAVSVAHAQEYNRFGKGPTTVGFTPPGYGVTSSYSRGNVYYTPAPVIATAPVVANAPVVATAPATGERRAFSAEPSAPNALAPAAPAVAPRMRRSMGARGDN